jgi:hypothetical protein
VIPLVLVLAAQAGEDFSVNLADEQTLRWSGYIENQAALMAFPAREGDEDDDGSGLDLMDYNKLRLQLEAEPAEDFSANANLIARSFHGTTSIALADVLPEKFADEIAMLAAWDPGFASYTMQDEIFINDAYFSAREGDLKLRMGKQPFRFGSGWFWNPTDPFTVKDMLDPSYEKEGVTAARLELVLPMQGMVQLWALPRQTFGDFEVEDSALAARARIAPGNWAFTGSYASYRDLAGLDPTAMSMEAFMVQGRRHLFGLDIAGDVLGVGLWAEGAYNRMQLDDWEGLDAIAQEAWLELDAGAQYVVPGGTTLMVEYLYNQRGMDSADDYTLWHWMLTMEQTIRALGQHYGTGTVQVPLERLNTDLALTGIANFSDGSWLLNPWVSWEWGQNLELSAYGAFGFGGENAELSATGKAGYLRGRFGF